MVRSWTQAWVWHRNNWDLWGNWVGISVFFMWKEYKKLWPVRRLCWFLNVSISFKRIYSIKKGRLWAKHKWLIPNEQNMVKEMLCELQGEVKQDNTASAWLLTLEPSPMLWGSSGHKESLGVQGRCSNWGEERPAVLAMLFLSVDCEQNKRCLFKLLNFGEIFRKKQKSG